MASQIEIGHVVRFRTHKRPSDQAITGVVVHIIPGLRTYEIAPFDENMKVLTRVLSVTEKCIIELDVLQSMSMGDRDLVAEWYAAKAQLLERKVDVGPTD